MVDYNNSGSDSVAKLDEEKSLFSRLKQFTKKCIFNLFIPIIGGEDAFPISIKIIFYIVETMQIIDFGF